MNESVARIFAEILDLPLESISDATAPENTPEWDSLRAMNLLTALEEVYMVRFSTQEMMSMRTVGMVRQILRGKGIDDTGVETDPAG